MSHSCSIASRAGAEPAFGDPRLRSAGVAARLLAGAAHAFVRARDAVWRRAVSPPRAATDADRAAHGYPVGSPAGRAHRAHPGTDRVYPAIAFPVLDRDEDADDF